MTSTARRKAGAPPPNGAPFLRSAVSVSKNSETCKYSKVLYCGCHKIGRTSCLMCPPDYVLADWLPSLHE